jgi:hypothetical protein
MKRAVLSHPKTNDLASRLDCSKPAVIGIDEIILIGKLILMNTNDNKTNSHPTVSFLGYLP